MEEQLKQCLSKYSNAEQTRKDVQNVLKHYLGLPFSSDPFVFNDGRSKNLVNLKGTIPVKYKGNTYHIPICIWIMDTHPNNAPLCYVTPTPDMCIKVSMFVDHNGKIYLPYLHDWQPSTSDLLGLIQVMICTFGEQPPVYAKPKTGEINPPYPTNSFIRQPPVISGNYLPYRPASNYPSTGTAFPPYPTTSNADFPGYPPYAGSYNTPYPLSNPNPPYPPASTSNTPPYPTFGGPANPNTARTGAPYEQYGQSGTITEEHIRASLLSAVEDKVKRRLREQFAQNQAELETLIRTGSELTQGKARLEEIFANLQREQTELDKNISMLKDKETELQHSVTKLQEQEGINVDEAVTTTAPLYKQLLNAYAEEAATEDAIYYLDEALRKGVIDLETFLKQVRALSRKQFMLRSIMQKCRQKAGLAG